MPDLSEKPSEKNWPFCNLKPIPWGDSERARELGRKGGLVRSERKAVANGLKGRKWCEPGCKHYWICAFSGEISKKMYEGQCGLKKQEPKVQGMMLELMTDDLEEMKTIRRLLIQMALGAGLDFKKQAILAEFLLKVYQAKHGVKSKVEVEKRDYKFIVEVRKAIVEVKKPESINTS